MAADQQVKVEIVADPSKGNAGLQSFSDRARSASDTVKGAFSSLQSSVRDMATATSRSLDAANEKWAEVKTNMGDAAEAMGPVLDDAQDHLSSFKDKTESVVKGIAISLGVGLLGATAAAIYTAVKIASAAATFIGGLFTGESYKSENIDALSKQIGDVEELAAKLQITRQEANATADALARLGVSKGDVVSTYEDATKAMRDNGDELDRLGVKYKDGDGKLLSYRQFLLNVEDALESFTEGYDRNAAAAAIGVGSLERVRAALSVTQDEVVASKQRVDDFNLGIGKETVEAEAAYQQAMRDFNNETALTSQGIKRAIADQIMPILTDLAVWFKEGWPTAVNAFRYTMATVTTLLYGLKNVAYMVSETVVGGLSAAGSSLAAIAKAYLQWASGDFSGARSTLVKGYEESKDRIAQIGRNIVDQIDHNNKAIALAWGMDDRDQGTVGGPGSNAQKGKTFEPKPKKPDDGPAENRVSFWANNLEEQKKAYADGMALQGNFTEWSHAEESRFWQGILERDDLSQQEKVGATARYLQAERNMRKQAAGNQLAELQVQIQDAASYYGEQERLAAEYTRRVGEMHGTESKDYQDALRRELQLKREHTAKLAEIENTRRAVERDDRLEDAFAMEAEAQLERNLGVITQAQLIAVRRQSIQQRRQIEVDAKIAELEAEQGGINDPVRVAAIQAEIAAIKRRYRTELKGNSDEGKVETAKPFDAFFGTSQQAIENGLQSMVTRMKITLNGVKDVARQVGSSLVNELALKPTAEWLVQQARMVAMTWLFGEQKVAAEATTQSEITAVQAAGSLKTIAMRAYEAAAGAYSAIAAIPYVGPVLAPIAAGVALAGVMAFAKSMFSAEGGFDIPRGMNPVVQAHANEMILPSKHADTIRMLGDLAQAGQLSGGSGMGNVQVNALDAKSFDRMLRGRQGDMIIRTLARHVRNRTAG